MSEQPADAPVLVLLHGLGANRNVWDGVAEIATSDGVTVYAPDIRGHGTAPWQDSYTFGAMAADVAEALQRDWGDRPYAAVGHSMGGAVALALASGWFGPPPVRAATVGVKLQWSDDELARIPDLASRPPRLFDDRDGAVDWFLKLSGLFGVIAADDLRIAAAVDAGVTPDESGRWRTSQDPATISVGPPDMAGLLPAAKCPVSMAIGQHDPLVTAGHHEELAAAAAGSPFADGVTSPHVFEGLGHNAMVEDPRAVTDWLVQIGAV